MDVHRGGGRAATLFVFYFSLFGGAYPAIPYVKPVAVFSLKEHQAKSGSASLSTVEGTYRRVGYNPYAEQSSAVPIIDSTVGTIDVTPGNVEPFPTPAGHQPDPFPYPTGHPATEPHVESSAYTRNEYPARQAGPQRRPGYPRSQEYRVSVQTGRRGYPQRSTGYPKRRYSAGQPRGYRRPAEPVAQPASQTYRNTNYRNVERRGYPQDRYSQPGSAYRQEPYRSRSPPARGYPRSSSRPRSYPKTNYERRGYPRSNPQVRGYPRSSTQSRGYPRSNTQSRGYPRSKTPTRIYPEGRRQVSSVQTGTNQPGYRSSRVPTARQGTGYPQGRRYPPTQSRRYPPTQSRTYPQSRGYPTSRGRSSSYYNSRTSEYRKQPVHSLASRRGYPRSQPSTRYQTPGRHHVPGQPRTPTEQTRGAYSGRSANRGISPDSKYRSYPDRYLTPDSKYGTYPRRNANAVHSLAARAKSSSYSRSYPKPQNSARYDTKPYSRGEFRRYDPKQYRNRAPARNADYYRTPSRYEHPPPPPPPRGYRQPQPSYPRGYPKSYYPGGYAFPQRPVAAPIPRAPTPAITTTTAMPNTTTPSVTTVSVEYEAPELEMSTGATGTVNITTTAKPLHSLGTPPPGVPAYIHNPKSGYANGYDQYGNVQGAPQQGGMDPTYNRYQQQIQYHGWDTGAGTPYEPQAHPVGETTPILPADVTSTPRPAVLVQPPFRPAEFKPYKYLNKYGLWETWFPHRRFVDKYGGRRL